LRSAWVFLIVWKLAVLNLVAVRAMLAFVTGAAAGVPERIGQLSHDRSPELVARFNQFERI
jgi:hypothetical protein